MAKKKKVLDALGPAAHWLDMSIAQRAKTKAYIKLGLQGYVTPDGVSIPGARRIYKSMGASEGFDLRHIERWSSAKLKTARTRIESLNTLTSRPFAVVIPRTAKQRKAAQKYTEQNLPSQKEFIVPVQDPKHDKVTFRDNQVTIERTMPKGSKTIKQRYLFRDYLEPDERMPISFREMKSVTERMLSDMPTQYYGRDVYYTIITVQYGPVGESSLHEDIIKHLGEYHLRYDTQRGHTHFAEAVIGFQMVGTYASAAAYQTLRERTKGTSKKRRKLAFSLAMQKSVNRCEVWKGSKRCIKRWNHKGKHKF